MQSTKLTDLFRKFPKETWYRIEEREKQKTPILFTREPGTVLTKRIIVRCGYADNPNELYGTALAYATAKFIAARTGITSAQAAAVLNLISGYDAGYSDFRGYDYPWPYTKMKHLYREVRRDAVVFKDRELRTLWYVDVPQQWLEFNAISYRKIGYYSAETEPGSTWDGIDYGDPPCFNETLTQGVYESNFKHLSGNNNHTWSEMKGVKIFIHPLDVIELRQETRGE